MNLTQLTDQEKHTLKNKAITELFNSGSIHKINDHMCWKNRIAVETRISEDVLQHAFMVLSAKSADYILDLYYDGGKKPKGCLKRLTGLTVEIIKKEGLATDKERLSSSVLKRILFASNFQQHEYLSPTEEGAEDGSNNQHLILVDESTEEESNFQKLWDTIRGELTPDELETLQWYLTHKKRQGRYKKEVKEKYNHLLTRIEEIINHHKVRI